METYHEAYLDRYLHLARAETTIDEDEYRAWLPIMAAARLREGIEEFHDWLLSQVRAGLRGFG